MIKRSRSEAAKVKKILSNTKTEFLQCRTYRRHPFIMPPEISLDPNPGKKLMTLVYHCPDCGTKRHDVYTVRIRRDSNHLDLEEFNSRSYYYPEGYSHFSDDPIISSLEYMEEYLNRIINAIN
jgi:hypothetical protein